MGWPGVVGTGEVYALEHVLGDVEHQPVGGGLGGDVGSGVVSVSLGVNPAYGVVRKLGKVWPRGIGVRRDLLHRAPKEHVLVVGCA